MALDFTGGIKWVQTTRQTAFFLVLRKPRNDPAHGSENPSGDGQTDFKKIFPV
jgi:hypothetical protein